MTTTREEIRDWLNIAKERGATHVIVVCDTYDWEDYPVMVMPGEDVRTKFTEYNRKDMQRIMEVYNLSENIDAQMKERRSFHF